MADWHSPWALWGGWGSFHWSFMLLVLCPMSVGFLAGLRGSNPSGVAGLRPGRGEAGASPPVAFLRLQVAVHMGGIWGNGTQDPGAAGGQLGT